MEVLLVTRSFRSVKPREQGTPVRFRDGPAAVSYWQVLEKALAKIDSFSGSAIT